MKLGIIGAGQAARRHFEAYRDLRGVEVVAIAGRSERHRGVFVGEGGREAFYTDYRELLARGDIEAVSLTTPTCTHAEIAQKCFDAGCHLLCEKPISRTLAEAQRMVAAAQRAERVFMMGFIMRFFPEYRTAKRLIEAGEIGEIKNVWMRRSRPLPEQAWYRDPEQSGGVISELGIHLIDLVRWLVPSPIQWVSAVMQGDVYRLGKEDNAWMLLEFANGAIGSIGASYSYSPVQSDFGVVGTEKSLTVVRDNGARVVVADHRSGCSEEHPADADAPDGLDPVRAELAHFVDCVRRRKTPIATGEDGAASLAIALAAVESANGAGRVAVDL